MSVHLTDDDARRLGAAAEALLAPVTAGDGEAWWNACEGPIRMLFPHANVVFTLPAAAARPVDAPERADAAAPREREEHSATYLRTGLFVVDDPALEGWLAHRRVQRIGLWGDERNDQCLRRDRPDWRCTSVWYDDGLLDARLYDLVGMSPDLAIGEMLVTLGYVRPGLGACEHASDMAMLGLLLPALRAAHHALETSRAPPRALRATLDAAGAALIAIGADGRELHRTTAVERALGADPARARLLATVAEMARELRHRREGVRRTGLRGHTPPEVTRTVVTAVARYILRGAHADERLWGAPGVATVSLEATPTTPAIALPTRSELAEALRARGLTRREAEVAHLLAQRLTNNELGAALGVSPHTAKRHTERVLAKLALHSRRELAAALSGAAASGPPAPSLTR